MTQYLITGASGFVGSNLIRKLINENKELTILIRNDSDLWRINDLLPKIQTIKTDLSDYEKLEKIISDIEQEFNVTIYDFRDRYIDLPIWMDVTHIAYHPDSMIYSQEIADMILSELP